MAIKLLYCIQSLHNSGGMERVLTTKANYLADKLGYEIHIAEKCNQGTPYFQLSSNIICHNLNARNNREYKKTLSKLLYEVRPDISISLNGDESTFLYKIKDGSKKIVEFHFTRYYLTYLINGIQNLRFRSFHKIKARIIQSIEKFYSSKYDKVVLLTKKDLTIWGNKHNMCYIYNPVSFYSSRTSTLMNKQIIAVGRYTAQKGFDMLIDSFAIIANEFKDWKLTIFGDGQDKKLYQDKINKYNLNGQIRLCNPTSDIKNEYLQSSIFVLSSRYEGFGLVLTEAMECGLPCIAFDCECGPSEIINNRETGYLVKPGNIIDFAEKMRKLILDKELRKTMGNAGKISVKKFHENYIMKKWDALFHELLN